MAVGSTHSTESLHPVLAKQFPDYPSGINKEGLIEVFDHADAVIVDHNASHTEEIDRGIESLRDLRQRVEGQAELPSEAAAVYAAWTNYQFVHNLFSVDLIKQI